MDCAAVKPRMEALVNGSLSPSEREPAEQHIAMCEGCRLELELVRAIGSQEKAPAVGKDDWTLDRIFGAEGAPGNAGEHAAPDASLSRPADESPFTTEPLAPPRNDDGSNAHVESIADPSPFASAMRPATPPPTPAPAAEPSSPASMGESRADPPPDKPKRSATSWDFEPADANANVKVPEESLFFATEALTRRKEPEVQRGSNLRVLLWGAGGLIGAILLAFSSWFVLHMSSPEDAGTKNEPEFDLEQPEHPGTTQPPAGGETEPPAIPDEPDQTAQSTTPAPEVAPATGTVLNPPPSTTRTSPPPVTRSSTSGPSFTPPPSGSNEGVAPKPATGSQRAPSPRTSGTTTQRTTGANSQRAVPGPVTRSPRSTAQAPDYGADEHIFGITPSPPRARDTNDDDLGPPPTPAPRTSPNTTTQKAPPPEPVKPAETPPPAPAPDTPIQRLHLATVAAGERGDLADLRRLRAAWKEFMMRVVGPDRSRARREYADCLWAIQSLTGKRGDQKDTLAAYREYLLTSPAGGADNRSASRLRQLEEAFTEKH
jgi:hypothetical protein